MNETERLLELLNTTFPDITKLDPLAARELVDARIRPAPNQDDANAIDHMIATSDNQMIDIRVYTPHEQFGGRPITIYAHGGGYLHGSIEGHDGFCRRWAKRTRSTVVSVGYRLAPEHGAPAACEDLIAAAEWAADAGLGEEIVLAGDSSGANAAAVAALALRSHQRIRVRAQILLYPFLDPNADSASYQRLGDSNFVTATTLRTYWRHYLAAPGTAEASDWQVNPTLAKDHAGAAPAVIISAGLDPLSDEDRRYAHRLRAAGVRVTLRHYPDQFHGFATILGYGPADSAQEILWSDIDRLLTR